MSRIANYGPGLVLTGLLALMSFLLDHFFPLIGSAVFAIILGMLVGNTWGLKDNMKPGVTYSGKKLLQYSIIFLGFTLSIQQVSKVGLSSLGFSLITITIAFLVALAIGRWLGLSPNLRLLIGFGTAICGGSAIAAASPIIEAEEEEVALSISTIFLFNVLAVFLFPFFGHLLGMSDADFGLWAGTAINDTSSVVAAAFSYSRAAGELATIVKLTRALMIVPICLGLVGLRIYRKESQEKVPLRQIFPTFILWFLLASLLSSMGFFPSVLIPWAKRGSQFLMAMALAGIGLQVSISQFKAAGIKPFLTGALAWIAVALASLFLQGVF